MIKQDKNFIKYCRLPPILNQQTVTLQYNSENEEYEWVENCIFNYTYSTEQIKCVDSIMMSAGVYVSDEVDHLLDGYTAAIVVNITDTHMKFTVKLIEDEYTLYIKEKRDKRIHKSGLFTSAPISFCKKLVGGNLFKFLFGGKALERETAHQPIYFPATQSVIYASGVKYKGFSTDLEKRMWAPTFKSVKSIYTCMHPQYDPTTKSLLTYTFEHSLLSNKTYITFYEYFSDKVHGEPVKYTVNERLVLHMFGFTKNYFIIFANPLNLEKHGQLKILFGKPLLRALNDNFTSDLTIHFIPRATAKISKIKSVYKPFSVNTHHQGFVYHTVNCFELDDDNNSSNIVIDAFVSNLNASRESSQFELNNNHNVHDNYGDPYRFIINTSDQHPTCKIELIASMLDSSIGFHCINENNNGKSYRYSWIISHKRIRDSKNKISNVVSTVYKIDQPNLDPTPKTTVTHEVTMNGSCYLRAPVFIQKKDSVDEDDGYIFVYSYSCSRSYSNKIKLLIFSADELELLTEIQFPDNFYTPYSVHSSSNSISNCKV